MVIAAKYDFTEAELCDHYRSPIGSRRDLSLFQVNFYGFLQEFILREMDQQTAVAETRRCASTDFLLALAHHRHQALFQCFG